MQPGFSTTRNAISIVGQSRCDVGSGTLGMMTRTLHHLTLSAWYGKNMWDKGSGDSEPVMLAVLCH